MQQDGKFVYYTIQHKTVAESPWLKPKEPLIPVPEEKQEWHFSSFDYFGGSFDKRHNTGKKPPYEWGPVNPKASDEIHNVWSKTGDKGWWTLKFAIAALKQVRQDDRNGKYNNRDSYGTLHAAIRHKFRIVKMTVSQRTEVINLHKDVVEAM